MELIKSLKFIGLFCIPRMPFVDRLLQFYKAALTNTALLCKRVLSKVWNHYVVVASDVQEAWHDDGASAQNFV